MMKRMLTATFSMLVGLSAAHAAETLSFMASDGGKVYGDVYPTAAPIAKATILLFHQAGSNRSEYSTIAPKLSALGYNAVAIDQRAGGDLWEHANETVRVRGGTTGYLDALPDLEGALSYATRTWSRTPVIVWGSSYSASLVFFLAARHPSEVAGLLSFSPGEYFSRMSVGEAAAKVRCPVFITSAPVPEEVAAAKRLLDAVPGSQKTQLVPLRGVHGASTLRSDANPAGAAQIWLAVDQFLAALPANAAGATYATPPQSNEVLH